MCDNMYRKRSLLLLFKFVLYIAHMLRALGLLQKSAVTVSLCRTCLERHLCTARVAARAHFSVLSPPSPQRKKSRRLALLHVV
jgi:hypothetical protein